MRVRVVNTLRGFDALAPVWRQLTEASGQSSPFVSHDWFACCWRCAGPNRHRETWVLEDAGGPIALVPLVRRRARVRGLPVRLLHVLDSSETPFADFPLVGSHEQAIGKLLDTLQGTPNWDLLSIGRLPARSATLQALQAGLAGRFPWRVAGDRQAPSVSLRGTWTEFLQTPDPSFGTTCLSLLSRVEGTAEVTLEEHTTVEPSGPIFTDLIDVSVRSSSARQGATIGGLQALARFYAELTTRASANGWLHLWFLRLKDRAVAFEYQIGADGHRYALRTEGDSDYAELDPAAYLNLKILRSFFDRRDATHYTTVGDPPAHLACAADRHRVVSLDVYAPTRYGRFLHGVETRLVPRARFLRSPRALRIPRGERCA